METLAGRMQAAGKVRAGRRWASAIGICLLVLATAAHGQAETSMSVTTPGDVWNIGTPETAPPWTLPAPWYAVSLKEDGHLILDTVRHTRKPDWHEKYEVTDAANQRDFAEHPPGPEHALDLPATALLGFRLGDVSDLKSSLPLRPGDYPSALPSPALLHDRWQATAQVDGRTWHLSTDSVRRKDGALLAGSLSLVATRDDGQKQVLMPPTEGAAFERQELLWLGTLHSGQHAADLDVLVRRTLLTGQVEYVLRVGGVTGLASFDPDRPYDVFSSGIGGYMTTDVHTSQQRPVPPERFGRAAFSIGDTAWNPAVDEAEKAGLPRVLFDRQLMLDDEKLRITIEYLPRFDATDAPHLTNASGLWGGPVLVKAHFRGKTQVLLESGRLDDGDFSLGLGKLEGEPAIQIGTQPHYNNVFTYDWVWDAGKQRFVRLYKWQSQGC